MDERTFRHVLHLQAVAHFDVGILSGNDLHAYGQALRSQDVTLFTIHIVQQCDVGRAVRIVFDRCDLSRDPILVALEIDDTVVTLVPSALMASGDVSVVVSSALALQRYDQRFLRLIGCDFFKCQG